MWGECKPLYNIERCLVHSGRQVNDGAHILYVNASIQDETPLGKLMSDMFCSSPEQMYYKELADRLEFLKSEKGGFYNMCELSEKLINFGKEQGNVEACVKIAKALLRKKTSIEDVAEVTGLSCSDVKELAQELDKE